MGYRLRWPKKNLTHCPGWVDHYNPSEMFAELGDHPEYKACDVLIWLGY